MIRALPFIFLGIAAPALAQGFQDTKLLDKAVAGFTGHLIGEDGGARTPIDARLKLASCPMMTMTGFAAGVAVAAAGIDGARSGGAACRMATKIRHGGAGQLTTTASWRSVCQAIVTIGHGASLSRGSTGVRAPPSSPAAWPVKPATALSSNFVS